MKIAELLQEQTLNELGTSPSSFSIAYSDEDSMEITSYDLGLATTFTRANDTVYIEFTVNGAFALTGRGNAVKVFATVKSMVEKCLPKFIEKSDRQVMFGADNAEQSRVSLYKRFVPIVSTILGPAWKTKPSYSDGSQTIYSWNRHKK